MANKPPKLDGKRSLQECNDTTDNMYYSHWFIFEKWVAYNITKAREKFWNDVLKVLKRDSLLEYYRATWKHWF